MAPPRSRRALEAAGAAMLACADIEEGIVLRRAGVRVPDSRVRRARASATWTASSTHHLTPTISTPSAARALQDAAARHGVVLHCHLKIDTGMNRLGFRHDNLEALASPTSPPARTSQSMPSTRTSPPPTIRSTRCSASSASVSSRRCVRLPALGVDARLRHAANTAALLRDERVWYDFVRPGLLLYGIVPPPLAATIRCDRRCRCTSRIVAVKGLRPGEGTGYGMKTVVDRPTTVAVVPAGYADGLDLRLAGRGHMLVRGRRAPIVGSVCMDMTMIDVTGTDAAPGDEVVILGQQDDEMMDVREMAAAVGTIPYELLCRLGARIQRVYE